MMLIVIALLLLSGTFFAACHKSSTETPPPAPAEQISNIVRNLTPNTTYFWKVVADDGKGGTSTSTVSSYTTGQ
jgi:outer membrane lipoprotein-sorting protein